MDTEVLWNLLANPADVKYANTSAIQSLVDEYPQSGIFRVLLAGNGNQQNIAHAAVYSNPATLYKLINAPDSFQPVTEDQIVWPGISLPADENEQPFPAEVVENHIVEQESVVSSAWVEDRQQNEDTTQREQDKDSDDAEVEYYKAHEAADVMQDLAEVEIAIEEEIKEEIQSQPEDPKEEAPVVEKEPKLAYPFTEKTEYFHQDIDDEIYDEIISIEDINLEQLAVLDKQSQNPDSVANHLARSDHFVFEPEVASEAHNAAEDKPEESKEEFESYGIPGAPNIIVAANETPINKSRDISRYNDEKLPYTFMWWLDKTRKEHATVYQPYVSNPSFNNANNNGFKTAKRDTMDELQQQYVESIFNVSVIDELERSTDLNNNGRAPERKEDKIIKRFIQSEPHIKHAGGVNLDSENKAKRSSEDADAMVTETLARIYTEQMLYQKAINTYKKLMLKFPEKSLYFASQIEQLENKPN